MTIESAGTVGGQTLPLPAAADVWAVRFVFNLLQIAIGVC